MSWRVLSISAAQETGFSVHTHDGHQKVVERPVIVETPIALEFNGIGYAVLMATPCDLEDLVTGFALSERLVGDADEVDGIDLVERTDGILVRCNLAPTAGPKLLERVRHRTSDSSCGLCGIESLEQALRTLPLVDAQTVADDRAVFKALSLVRGSQPLNRETGAAHGAFACAADGSIRLAREDVGRHNALDKLIGAMARQAMRWDGGFALISSRCSYEMVEKAALANCPMLVAISAPTSLALSRAAEAKLRLISLARTDSFLSV